MPLTTKIVLKYYSYGLQALNKGFSEAPEFPLSKYPGRKVAPKIFLPVKE